MQSKKTLIALVALVAVLTIGFLGISLSDQDASNQSTATDAVSVSTQDDTSEDKAGNEDIQTTPEDESVGDNIEGTQPEPADSVDIENIDPQYETEANLVAEPGYQASGVADRSYDGTTFTHSVMAEIQDPAEGKFFEGWIVGPSVISTGKMTKQADGSWRIDFESDQDLTDHNKVVITEETEADGLDGKPETHVLEGSF